MQEVLRKTWTKTDFVNSIDVHAQEAIFASEIKLIVPSIAPPSSLQIRPG